MQTEGKGYDYWLDVWTRIKEHIKQTGVSKTQAFKDLGIEMNKFYGACSRYDWYRKELAHGPRKSTTKVEIRTRPKKYIMKSSAPTSGFVKFVPEGMSENKITVTIGNMVATVSSRDTEGLRNIIEVSRGLNAKVEA